MSTSCLLINGLRLSPFQAFNEELDGLYNDAILPHTEAWQAMTSDLRQTKAARNNLANENSYVYFPILLTSKLIGLQ